MTTLPVLDPAAIDALVTPADVVASVERSFRAVSQGTARQPARTLMPVAGGALGMMPGEVTDPAVFGIKLVSLFPEAAARGLSSHQGLVLLFDGETGAPKLIAEAGHLTALRTAAASLVSARELRRPGPFTLGLVGCGEQARLHARLFRAELPPERILVWGRRADAARAFGAREGAEPVARLEELCAEADVICTLTKAAEPILLGRWLRPGQHLVAAGSSVPGKREIDGEVLSRAFTYLDWREGALREAGDLTDALASGTCDPGRVRGEIGELLLGRIPGRQSTGEITLFKSLGVAAHDLLLARLLLERMVTA